MKKVKVTVTAILTLAPGVELVERFVDDEEELGAHLRVGGKLYCPAMEWMFFVPRTAHPAREQALGLGHGYQTDETADAWFYGGAEPPIIDHAIEPIEE